MHSIEETVLSQEEEQEQTPYKKSHKLGQLDNTSGNFLPPIVNSFHSKKLTSRQVPLPDVEQENESAHVREISETSPY